MGKTGHTPAQQGSNQEKAAGPGGLPSARRGGVHCGPPQTSPNHGHAHRQECSPQRSSRRGKEGAGHQTSTPAVRSQSSFSAPHQQPAPDAAHPRGSSHCSPKGKWCPRDSSSQQNFYLPVGASPTGSSAEAMGDSGGSGASAIAAASAVRTGDVKAEILALEQPLLKVSRVEAEFVLLGWP